MNDSNDNEEKDFIDLIQIEKHNNAKLRLVEQNTPEKSPRDFPINNESPIAGNNEDVPIVMK